MTLSGQTQLAAVIGQPVRHSLSPVIHNAGFAALGLDWAYLAFEVAPASAVDAVDAMRSLGIRGLSVTMPHKFAVVEAVDELTPAANALGAVNCITNRDGVLIGDNTDGGGFLDGLAHDAGFDPADRRCLVLGAGGAARAVIHALGAAGASDVAVANRSTDRAKDAATLAGAVGRVVLDTANLGAELSRFDLVINATAVGMAGGPSPDALPCPVDDLTDGQLLVDLVYEPGETPWLTAARKRGIRSHNGLSMLVFQAARAFASWTGQPAPIEAMVRAAQAGIASR